MNTLKAEKIELLNQIDRELLNGWPITSGGYLNKKGKWTCPTVSFRAGSVVYTMPAGQYEIRQLREAIEKRYPITILKQPDYSKFKKWTAPKCVGTRLEKMGIAYRSRYRAMKPKPLMRLPFAKKMSLSINDGLWWTNGVVALRTDLLKDMPIPSDQSELVYDSFKGGYYQRDVETLRPRFEAALKKWMCYTWEPAELGGEGKSPDSGTTIVEIVKGEQIVNVGIDFVDFALWHYPGAVPFVNPHGRTVKFEADNIPVMFVMGTRETIDE